MNVFLPFVSAGGKTLNGNLLGVHYIPTHGRTEDLDYIVGLNPSVVRFIDADSSVVRRVWDHLGPSTLYYLRNWALSEQKEDMRRDPEGTGIRHARQWALDYDLHYSFIPRERVVVSPVNEPAVWEDLSAVPYNVAFLDECRRLGLAGGALQLSVGWPNNRGGDTRPDWTPFGPVLSAIERGNHYLSLNEYWDERGPLFNWGWWAGRFTQCPWPVRIIIGEFGLDKYVSDGGVNEHKRGWQGWLNPAQYAGQVRDYLERCAKDPRIVGTCLYTTDYGHPWASFDTNPAHGELGRVAVNYRGEPIQKPPPAEPPVLTNRAIVHPLPGAPLSQHYGENGERYLRFNLWGHNGTDWAAPLGTPVLSAAAGEVAMVDVDNDYGNYVRVWHPQLLCHTFYAHLDKASVRAGQRVVAGQKIGECGTTGNSTGPHLHFEVRLANEGGTYLKGTPMPKGRVDPETWMLLEGRYIQAVHNV